MLETKQQTDEEKLREMEQGLEQKLSEVGTNEMGMVDKKSTLT